MNYTFFQAKTTENDLWWEIILSKAVKLAIFSIYGTLSWKKKASFGKFDTVFIDILISFAWQIYYVVLCVSRLLKSIIF